MKAERVVLDTNVLISAVLQPKGPPRAAIDAVRNAAAVLLFSDQTFDELRTRLESPKSAKYVSTEGRTLFLVQIIAVSEWIAIAGATMGCRDPGDDKLLETAMLGEADCLVTGDRDLLVMSPFHDMLIVTPADLPRNYAGN